MVRLTKKSPETINEIRSHIEAHPDEINKQNVEGWTALKIACRNSRTWSTDETVELLLRSGADANIKDTDGRTALMAAVAYSSSDSSYETIKLLLEYGADINMADYNGVTVLMHHIIYNPADNRVIRFLLENGADVNAVDSGGWTALMLCLLHKYTNIEIMTLLLEYGAQASINFKTARGESALTLAFKPLLQLCSGSKLNRETSRTITSLLLRWGADVEEVLKHISFGIYDSLEYFHSSLSVTLPFEGIRFLIEYPYVRQIENLNKELQSARDTIRYYETSLQLHPDGDLIKEFKSSFMEKASAYK